MTTLRGPADPERFRIFYKRSRHYFDDLPADPLRPEGPMTKKADALPAVSTIKQVESKGGLIYWAVGLTAEAAVDTLEKWSPLDRDDAVDYLKKQHTKQRDRAADRGTRMHEIVERRMRGESPSIWDDVEGDAAAYMPAVEQYIADLDPELLYAEVVGIGHRHGCTTDAIVRLNGVDGAPVVLVDYKSRRGDAKNPHVVYPGEVCQIGANAAVRYLIVEDNGQARREPVPTLEAGMLVTFTPDRYVAHRIELAPAIEAFNAMADWWAGEKTARKAVGAPYTPANANAAPVDPTPSETPETATQTPIRDDLRRRIQRLIDDGHETVIVRRWPDNVPGLSDATPTALPLIERAVQQAEAEVGAPFDPAPTPPPPARTVDEPEPAPNIPDEGAELRDAELEPLRAAFAMLEPEQAEWIAGIAGAARNLSLTEKRSERRFSIGWAIVRLAVAGWHSDELLAAVIAEVDPAATTPARALAAMHANNAKRLSTVVDALIADRYTFSVSPETGRMRLTEVA